MTLPDSGDTSSTQFTADSPMYEDGQMACVTFDPPTSPTRDAASLAIVIEWKCPQTDTMSSTLVEAIQGEGISAEHTVGEGGHTVTSSVAPNLYLDYHVPEST